MFPLLELEVELLVEVVVVGHLEMPSKIWSFLLIDRHFAFSPCPIGFATPLLTRARRQRNAGWSPMHNVRECLSLLFWCLLEVIA